MAEEKNNTAKINQSKQEKLKNQNILVILLINYYCF